MLFSLFIYLFLFIACVYFQFLFYLFMYASSLLYFIQFLSYSFISYLFIVYLYFPFLFLNAIIQFDIYLQNGLGIFKIAKLVVVRE